MVRRITIFDTTLRDGTQGRGVSLSIHDKLDASIQLDDFGMDYIEGGWPGSNLKDTEFFDQMKSRRLEHAKLVAFGCTRKPHLTCYKDPMLQALISADTSTVHIVGKCLDADVHTVLNVSLSENLDIIHDTVLFLSERGREVFFAGEHFFDAYRANPEYALDCLRTAKSAGATILVLADTNGGCLPDEIRETVSNLNKLLPASYAIHAHDDSGCAVANSIAAINAGASQVQGTINGYGERCGNANLITLAANLKLKLGLDCLLPDSLQKSRSISAHFQRVSGRPHIDSQPYVGNSAYSHKGGVHVDGVLKEAHTYEHVPPETVGNTRDFLISDLSGGSLIVERGKSYGLSLEKGSPEVKLVLRTLAEKEARGYVYEHAEASFELLLREACHVLNANITIDGAEAWMRPTPTGVSATCRVMFTVRGDKRLHSTEGNDVILTLDRALREGLSPFCVDLKQVRITGYDQKLITRLEQSKPLYRTIVEYGIGDHSWRTIGVAGDLVTSAWNAIRDGIRFYLLRSETIASALNPRCFEVG